MQSGNTVCLLSLNRERRRLNPKMEIVQCQDEEAIVTSHNMYVPLCCIGCSSSLLFFFFLQSTIIFFFSIYRKIIWCIFPPVHFMKEIFNLIPVIVMYLLLLVFPSNKLSFGSYQVSYLFIESLIYFLFFLLLFVDLYFFKLKLSWHHLSFVLARVTVQHFKQPDFTVKSVVLNCEQIKTTSERRHQNMRWMFILLSVMQPFFSS